MRARTLTHVCRGARGGCAPALCCGAGKRRRAPPLCRSQRYGGCAPRCARGCACVCAHEWQVPTLLHRRMAALVCVRTHARTRARHRTTSRYMILSLATRMNRPMPMGACAIHSHTGRLARTSNSVSSCPPMPGHVAAPANPPHHQAAPCRQAVVVSSGSVPGCAHRASQSGVVCACAARVHIGQ